MTLEIRYFFEFGGGVCLWAKNDAARERFDCAIDHHKLDISTNTKKWLDYLLAWYDTFLDWESAPDERRTSYEEGLRFNEAAIAGLAMLRKELPPPEWEFEGRPAYICSLT